MKRIFPILAAGNALALLASFLLGTISKLQDGVHRLDVSIYWQHFLVGLVSANLTLFVHCIIFTYFLGTGRWVKEVAQAYGIPDQPLPKLTRELKRKAFPPALFSMLFAIATVAAGAAAHVQTWPWQVHAILASLTLVVNLWAFRVEYRCLSENVAALEGIENEVERIRRKRGLGTNAEALLEDAV